MECRMMRHLTNVKGLGRRRFWSNRYCPDVWLEGLRFNTNISLRFHSYFIPCRYMWHAVNSFCSMLHELCLFQTRRPRSNSSPARWRWTVQPATSYTAAPSSQPNRKSRRRSCDVSSSSTFRKSGSTWETNVNLTRIASADIQHIYSAYGDW
jgi:hypothetical protein